MYILISIFYEAHHLFYSTAFRPSYREVDVTIKTRISPATGNQVLFVSVDWWACTTTLAYSSRKNVFILLGSTMAVKAFPLTSNRSTRLTLCVLSVR